MNDIVSDLFVNILANIIFWLGLGLLFRYVVISRARTEFLRFFGLETNKRLVVYLSNLWLPSITLKPWGCILSGQEFRVTKTVSSLFGSAPLNFPEQVKGLVDTFWIGKSLDVSIEVSSVGEHFDLACNMIVVGTSTKNSVRRYYLNRNMVYVTIAGEPTNSPTDKDILANPLEPRFVIMKGKQTGETVQRKGKYNLAVVERIRDEEDRTIVFMCTGLRGDSSWAATEYLARNWRKLYRKFGDKEFACCLWFSDADGPMEHYREPIHIRDLPAP